MSGTSVDLAVSSWEAPSPDGQYLSADGSPFKRKAHDVAEEVRVRKAAAAALRGGKWSTPDTLEVLMQLTTPSLDNAFLGLAALIAIARIGLIGAWIYVEVYVEPTGSWILLGSRMWASVNVNGVAQRLTIMYALFHLSWLAHVCHACRDGSVTRGTRYYAAAMSARIA